MKGAEMMRFVVKTASMEKNRKHVSDGMEQPCSTMKISSMCAWRLTPLSGTGKLPALSHENFESAPLCHCSRVFRAIALTAFANPALQAFMCWQSAALPCCPSYRMFS